MKQNSFDSKGMVITKPLQSLRLLLIMAIPLLVVGCSNNTGNKSPLLETPSTEVSENTVKSVLPMVEKPLYGIIPTILNFTAVDPTLFQELYDTGEMTVIDVRTPQEIAEGKIFEDALEIDFYNENFKDKISKLDRNKKYLIYCRSGNRSGKGLQIFDDLGFMEAYDLAGGKLAWDKSEMKQEAKTTKREILQDDQSPPRVINISAKMYEFSTHEIRVKQGEKVLLKIENLDTTHGIRIPKLNQNGNEELLLDTSQKGTFPFTCNNLCGVGHSDMKGQIIIE